MANEQFESVWDAISDTPAEAENMKLRSAVMMALREHIRGLGLTQEAAASLMGVTRPRVSDLMRGKIGLFTIDALVNMAAGAGLTITVSIGAQRAA
jgi:predicted XRE-type DNA-binding protein